jgi:hypothetical protein
LYSAFARLPSSIRSGYIRLLNNQVAQTKDIQTSPQLPPRWTAVLLSCGLVALWLFGVLSAIDGGHHPGKHPRGVIRPYPTEAVAWICARITVETVLLYFLLRPNTFARHPRRTLIALAVFVPLWMVDGIALLATDLPAYCYSNPLFLSYVVLFLGLLFIISFSDDLGRRKLTPHDQTRDSAKS